MKHHRHLAGVSSVETLYLWVFWITVIGWIIFSQITGRQQLDVHSPLPPAEADRVITKYFGVAWDKSPSGSREYGFKPRARAYAPTLSVSCEPAQDAGSLVRMWLSGYHTYAGVMAHATLMWRKKRGLAKRLTQPVSP